ncbi:hypothetical protein [Sulfurihydrogenibium sp.]|jgi:hypothetical protein|nr:hypothetical protein [Sulfurihydrogenibium sp.]
MGKYYKRKLLKQVKELDDVMEKHPEIIFRLQVVELRLFQKSTLSF